MRNASLGCVLVLLAATARGNAQQPAQPSPYLPASRVAAPAPTTLPKAAAEPAHPHPEPPKHDVSDLLELSHHGHAHHEEEEEHHEEEHHQPERLWVRAEYLLWYIKNSDFPPLITTGDPNVALPGALGQPGTIVLFGATGEDNKDRSGGRFTAGWWLTEETDLGIEASYLFLGSRSIGRALVSSSGLGAQVLARPFFDVLAQREDSSLVAFPSVASGFVSAYAHSFLQGAEGNAICHLWGCEGIRVDALAGFRWLELEEDLEITERSQLTPGAPQFPGALIGVSDRFGVRNDFYGGQVGVRAEFTRNRLFAEVRAKVALGVTHQVVDVNGGTTINTPGVGVTTAASGLLALASNSGSFTRDKFAVVPEVGVNAGFRFNEHFRVFAGYTWLYISEVVRPGDQIDRNLSPTQIPTSQLAGALVLAPRRPVMPFNGTDFWAHGVSVGLEIRY
ncbi:MAG: BBP7 family outer membrane beta-barrel protein [Gemmataceae bacterium]|nr:BBP7 family outer membrane beta-barrel protein [Gemmataceae bacterium]